MKPNKIRILGKTYSVKFTNDAPVHEDAQGHCDYLKLRLTVREGLAPAEERSTLLHEALHAVSQAMGMNLSEAQVGRLEGGLFAMIRDNPEFIDYLKKKD
jgi:hypothetical protein